MCGEASNGVTETEIKKGGRGGKVGLQCGRNGANGDGVTAKGKLRVAKNRI